jgi:transposase-like protein
MDLARLIYSRDLKVAVMRAVDSGSTIAEVARKHQVSPKLIERWRGEWRAKGEAAFPGVGRGGAEQAAVGCSANRRAGAQDRPADDGERLFLKALVHFRDHHQPVVVSGATACLKKSGKRPAKARK